MDQNIRHPTNRIKREKEDEGTISRAIMTSTKLVEEIENNSKMKNSIRKAHTCTHAYTRPQCASTHRGKKCSKKRKKLIINVRKTFPFDFYLKSGERICGRMSKSRKNL